MVLLISSVSVIKVSCYAGTGHWMDCFNEDTLKRTVNAKIIADRVKELRVDML